MRISLWISLGLVSPSNKKTEMSVQEMEPSGALQSSMRGPSSRAFLITMGEARRKV